MLDNVTDFLIEMGMKPCKHLIEISIFSLNKVTVTVRLNKIIKNLFEHLKIIIFKVNIQVEYSQKIFEQYCTRKPILSNMFS